MNSKEALKRLVAKTGLLNDTCTNLIDCIKCKKCIYNAPCETCDDYNLVMTIKQDLEQLKKLKKVIDILKKEPIILTIGFDFWKYDEKENLYYCWDEEYDYDYDSDDWEWVEVKHMYLKEDFELLKEVLRKC